MLSIQQTTVLELHTEYVFITDRFSSPKFHCLLTVDCSHLQVDINTLDADALEPLNADLWLLSPACQPYTVLNPNSKGASDPRAQSFLYLIEGVLTALAERGAGPTRLLIENVAGFEVRGHVLSQAFSLQFIKEIGIYYKNSRTLRSQKTGVCYAGIPSNAPTIRHSQLAVAILSLSLTHRWACRLSCRLGPDLTPYPWSWC